MKRYLGAFLISCCACLVLNCRGAEQGTTNAAANANSRSNPVNSTGNSSNGNRETLATAPDATSGAGGTDFAGAYSEEREICGNTIKTPELHDVRCPGSGCDCRQGWCFRPTELTVSVPSDKWVFIGPPRIDCAQNNQGSCQWNRLGASDLTTITMNNPNEIRARILTNSRSIGVRVCAMARYYP
jgi:hypothetical protein